MESMVNPIQLSEPGAASDLEALPTADDPTDEALAARARAGDRTAFELLMRRNNRRVYRTIRAVLRDGAEVEDAMQEAYVSAFTHLDQFQGAARWSTWLCRIAYNEALARVRRGKRFVSIDASSEAGMQETDTPRNPSVDPERAASDRELARVLEGAIDRLPDIYRAVLVLRQIDGLSVADTAEVLDVAEEVVKTRLHRARSLLRAELEERIGSQLDEAYASAPRASGRGRRPRGGGGRAWRPRMCAFIYEMRTEVSRSRCGRCSRGCRRPRRRRASASGGTGGRRST
jgi:RNA polymerase sigma-70 factor (ECF subfamily)